MNVFKYTKQIGASIACGDMTEAIHLFNCMKNEGIRPDVVTYNVLMDGFSKANDAANVCWLFDEMLDIGIQPNTIVFNTAIRACAINIDVKRAGMLFGLMRKKFGLKPNATTYGTLIHVCAVAGQLSLAKKCYASMLKQGIACHIVACNSLIDAYAEVTNRKNGEHHLHECRLLLEDIEERGYPPDERTLGVFMKLCTRGGLLREALDLIPEMESKGVYPTVVTYGTLLDGLVKDTTISNDRAAFTMKWILDEMKRRRLRLNLHAYNTLLNLCCKTEDLKMANHFFKRLKEDKFVKPDIICYGTMMKCYEKLGDPKNKKAYLKPFFTLQEELKAAGLKIDYEITVTQVSACGNVGDVERALAIWKRAMRSGIAADFGLYGAMIKACLRANDRQQALEFLTQMESKGKRRSEAICDMFLRYYLQTGMRVCAKQFLKEMRLKGVKVTSILEKEVEHA